MAKSKVNRGIRFGLMGGLVSTIAMDLVMVGVLSVMGKPAGIFFSFIGEAAGAFLPMIKMAVRGGIPLGTALHYLIGLLLGVIFGAIVTQIDALRTHTVIKAVVLGIIYTEVASMALLVPAAMILKMNVSDMLQLFGLAFAFHLVYGAVLGVFVSHKLRSRVVSSDVSTSK